MPIKLHPSTVQTIRVALPIDLAVSKLKRKGKGAKINKDAMPQMPNPMTAPQPEEPNAGSEAPGASVVAAAPTLAGLLFPNGL